MGEIKERQVGTEYPGVEYHKHPFNIGAKNPFVFGRKIYPES